MHPAAPTKRSSRVTFAGVSNLPKEKAQGLANALQKIIYAIVDVYNACDDPKMKVDDRYQRVGSLETLTTDIELVCKLVNEELSQCEPNARSALLPRSETINACAAVLHTTFKSFSNNGQQTVRGELANTIFDNLLKIVEVTIDLLKHADKGAINKMVSSVTEVLVATRRVRDATTITELSEVAPECSFLSIELVKRISHRIAVLPDKDGVREKARQATEMLKVEVPSFIAMKRSLITSPTAETEHDFGVSVGKVAAGLKTLLEVVQVAPEFSVVFEVEYFDDALGVGVASLALAIDKGDEEAVLQHARSVVAEVQQQVRQGREMLPSLPLNDRERVSNACDTATAAAGEVVKAGRDALQAKKAIMVNNNTPEQTTFAAAEKRMVEAGRKLRRAIEAIPLTRPVVAHSERMALLEAARKIVLNLNTLLYSLE